jgi:ketosteroid isomerase-like protein
MGEMFSFQFREQLYCFTFVLQERERDLNYGGSELDRIKQVMSNIYRAFEELDAEKLDVNFSHTDDLVAFGTDWDEKFVGWNQYREVHKVQFSSLKSFKFESKELEVRLRGSVAWVSDRPHWEIETKDGERVKNDVRVTAVLKKEDDGNTWKIVQWHVSVGLRERLHEY